MPDCAGNSTTPAYLIAATSMSPAPYLNTPISTLPTSSTHSTRPATRRAHLSLGRHPTVAIRNTSTLRLLSSAARRAPKSVPLGRRGYAKVADKRTLSPTTSPQSSPETLQRCGLFQRVLPPFTLTTSSQPTRSRLFPRRSFCRPCGQVLR